MQVPECAYSLMLAVQYSDLPAEQGQCVGMEPGK